jgi:hypothetical protein
LKYVSVGKKIYAIREPSSGGNGMRLKNIRLMLREIPRKNITAKSERTINRVFSLSDSSIQYLFPNITNAPSEIELIPISVNLKRRVKIIARHRLEIGPAAALMAISRLGFLKFLVLIGTGFAQPTLKKSIEINPNGLICLRGLRVNLPRFFAVVSPSLYATKPCAAS